MKRPKLTRNAKAFKEANTKQPVVMGSVLGPHGGCTYTLKGGRAFTLTAAECRAVGDVRWNFTAPLVAGVDIVSR